MSGPQPRRMTFAFYNFAPPSPNRGPARLADELRALANVHPVNAQRRKPKVIGGCEAIGYGDLPPLDGYHAPIRDRSTPEHANVCLYVRDDLAVTNVRWHDLHATWARTEHGGAHPARTIISAQVGDWTVLVGHGPPTAPGAGPAREEYVTAVVRLLRCPGPILLLHDPNDLDAAIARRVTVTGVGTTIESAVGRAATLEGSKVPAVNGVPLMSDHRGALLGTAVRK